MKYLIFTLFLLIGLTSCGPSKEERIIQYNLDQLRANSFGPDSWSPNMTPIQQANWDWKQSQIEKFEKQLATQ